MKVLGIDISSKAIGLAVLEDPIVLFMHTLVRDEDERSGPFYQKVRHVIRDLIRQYGVREVVMEDLNIRFLGSGKQILPLHGVVKEVVFDSVSVEAVSYNVATWRFNILGLSRYTKAEKDHAKATAKTKKEAKRMVDVKNKVITYVNGRLGLELTYKENDVADALGLCIAHTDVALGRVKIKPPKVKKRKKDAAEA